MGCHRNLSGEKFGRWTVLEGPTKKSSKNYWHCRCECGKQKFVYGNSLISGKSISCGCLNTEVTIARCLNHGHANGGNGTRTYNCWRNMKARCSNPKNHKWIYYGGRGINYCSKWEKFSGFLADMGECPSGEHSIDRIDNNGNYEPGNCRWATRFEQMNNQSTNRVLTFQGKTQTIAQWAKDLGLKPPTISRRLNSLGWSVDRALTEKTQFWPHSFARN